MDDDSNVRAADGHQQLREWNLVSLFLRSSAAYVGMISNPTVIETHVSLVFMTSDHVYKLKKPIHFKFLDFSSRIKRKEACEHEVVLNTRLATGIYQGTATVALDEQNRLSLNGNGRILEWLVVMRRLPGERMFDKLMAADAVSAADIENLAKHLAAFYRKAPRVELSSQQYADKLRQLIHGNRQDLLSSASTPTNSSDTIKRIHGRQLQFLAFEAAIFESRVRAGRIIDGHGDLRPEHVCLLDPPVVFDCIEFSTELRQIDFIDDLAFFGMECDRLGKHDIASQLLTICSKLLHDDPPPSLINFHKSYRAMIRAKVAALRLSQAPGDAFKHEQLMRSYFKVADCALGGSSRTLCLIMRGRSGTGKSTLAKTLADALGMELLQSDQLRRNLYGAPVTAAKAKYGEGRYAPESRFAIYQQLFKITGVLLTSQISVVLDACFLSEELIRQAATIANQGGAIPVNVHVSCEESIVRRRLAQRNEQALSEASIEHYRKQGADESDDPNDIALISVETSKGDVDTLTAMVIQNLAEIVATTPNPSATEHKTA